MKKKMKDYIVQKTEAFFKFFYPFGMIRNIPRIICNLDLLMAKRTCMICWRNRKVRFCLFSNFLNSTSMACVFVIEFSRFCCNLIEASRRIAFDSSRNI